MGMIARRRWELGAAAAGVCLCSALGCQPSARDMHLRTLDAVHAAPGDGTRRVTIAPPPFDTQWRAASEPAREGIAIAGDNDRTGR